MSYWVFFPVLFKGWVPTKEPISSFPFSFSITLQKPVLVSVLPYKNYPRQLTYKKDSLVWSQIFCVFGLWLVPLCCAHGKAEHHVRSMWQQNCPVSGYVAKEKEERAGFAHNSMRRPPTQPSKRFHYLPTASV